LFVCLLDDMIFFLLLFFCFRDSAHSNEKENKTARRPFKANIYLL